MAISEMAIEPPGPIFRNLYARPRVPNIMRIRGAKLVQISIAPIMQDIRGI